jgi:predicted AlkP superfamily pyrophosphatase or phosphodiesterase
VVGLKRSRVWIAAALWALLSPPCVPQSAPPRLPAQARPKLIVLLVTDQMRGDYLEKYGHQWTGGLRRLITEGAWFRQARYPYWRTVTCAGHATISTGTFPVSHGMVGNSWYEQAEKKQTTCTADDSVQGVSSGRPTSAGHESAHRLRRPTFADELRWEFKEKTRIVSFSRKARGAIMLGGFRPDVAMWFDDAGNWITSTAFARETPAFLREFAKQNPVEADYGKVWERLMPASEYLYTDNGVSEHPPAPWDATFPHKLVGAANGGKADTQFYRLWINSPYADEYILRVALATVDAMNLGHGEATDYLAVSFSALDAVGHGFGPQSHEVQDVLLRLDRTIGSLFEHLDRTVGRENYVVAMSADHGVSPILEQMKEIGLNAGRQPLTEITKNIEGVLAKRLGKGPFVARALNEDLIFAEGIYERIRREPGLLDEVIRAITVAPGIARVVTREEIRSGLSSADPVARAYAMSTYPGRDQDPDMVLIPRPYWQFVREPRPDGLRGGASHGSGYLYDQHVPVIFLGPMFRAGHYLSQVTPADIAPTLAFVTGITMAQSEGRVLREAFPGQPQTDEAAEKKEEKKEQKD